MHPRFCKTFGASDAEKVLNDGLRVVASVLSVPAKATIKEAGVHLGNVLLCTCVYDDVHMWILL
ncbi:hypothetical protein HanOQP8_Chr05g0174641 [Helianthus annuus]|nr:hypothetical protein HanOQP8_Chr05g0174641 [Helianthus annuus]